VAKYKIGLEVTGVDMYHTVMKVIEANPEIRVTEAGMVIGEKKARNVPTRKHSKEKFEEVYYRYLQENLDKNRRNELTTSEVMKWCSKNGYARSSATSLASLMVKRGYFAKTGTRGIYLFVWP
jgi:hypothetical protein